jgi:hypothetical protein
MPLPIRTKVVVTISAIITGTTAGSVIIGIGANMYLVPLFDQV